MNEERPYIIELAVALNKASYTDIKLLAEKVGVDPSQYEYKYKLVEGITRKIGALTTRPEPAADAIERAAEAIHIAQTPPYALRPWAERVREFEEGIAPGREYGTSYVQRTREAARKVVAALQAAAVEPEPGLSLDELMDIDAFASEFGDQLNERLKLEWEFASFGMQAEIRQAIRMSLRVAIQDAVRQAKENGDG